MFDWFEWFEWELADPWFLLLGALGPLVYWLASRPSSLLGYSSLTLLAHTRRSWRQRLSRLPAILLTLALVALVIALARPRTPLGSTRVTRDGIAIMMVVDRSPSMNARDMVTDDQSVNRLHAAKDVFRDFVLGTGQTAGRGRADDRIGMVTFAGYADSLCPLTLDHGNLVNILKDVEVVTQREEDGTALGDGLGLAVERLRRDTAKSRVAILLTDGVNNRGVIEPMKAAKLARQCDVKVYTIGVGTQGIAPMPGVDRSGRTVFFAAPVEIDESTLKQIAEQTGGRYFRAVDKDSLAGIYREIDTLERTEVTEARYSQYTEHFPYFAGTGLGLLMLGMLLSGSLFRRLP